MILNQTWEISVILFLQDLGDWLTPIMQVFTSLGYGVFYLLFVPLIYWCLDSRLGIKMTIFLQLSASVNGILKQATHAPRPYWIDSQIKVIHASTSFGMPSGHAQMSTIWLLVAAYTKKKWSWIIALTITLMVGVSRAYLGVHFPTQIVAGWIIGGAMVLTWLCLEGKVIHWMQTKTLFQQFLLVFCGAVILLLIGGIFVYRLTGWHIPPEWLKNAPTHLEKDMINPVGLKGIASYTGGFLGASLGTILVSRFGGHDVGGVWWKRVLRYIVGLICLLLLLVTLEAMSPDKEHAILYDSWRLVEHFLILFSVIFIIPLLFLRLKLANRAKESLSDIY